jgi:hypothetical protein
MSGNIHDTNTILLRQQVNDMIRDLQNKAVLLDLFQIYKNKYNYLYTTSKTLFEFILKNFTTESFDKEYFHKSLAFMLEQIELIQSNKVSQYTASSNVGYHFADKYMSHLKDK